MSVPSDDSVGVLFGPQGHPAGPSIVSVGKHEISPYQDNMNMRSNQTVSRIFIEAVAVAAVALSRYWIAHRR